MLDAVTEGRFGTAMKSFAATLSPREIEAVVDFVRIEFMLNGNPNTRYHTAENGWPDHEKYQAAFPFALGQIALDAPESALTKQQRVGKVLFMNACITCHDRARVEHEGVIWDVKAVSFPRNRYTHKNPSASASPVVDSRSGATPYAKHDKAPLLSDLSSQERRGESLFQANCAFCHAMDGTGKNWIGSFLEPHPRNLTDPEIMSTMTRKHVKAVVMNGIEGTTMSAWRSVLSEQEIDSVVAYINKAFHPLK